MKNVSIKLTSEEREQAHQIALRQIVESNLSDEQKMQMIDNLVALSGKAM